MRPIDADALIDDIKNHLWDWENVNGITAQTVLKQTITDIKNQPTVNPWHRVEEPPKKTGKYAVCWTYQEKIYWDWLLFADGNWVLQTGLPLPNYWMPIEPPKEDA